MVWSAEIKTTMKGAFAKSKILRYFEHKIDCSGKKQLAFRLLEDSTFAKKATKLNTNFSTLVFHISIFCKSTFQLFFFLFKNYYRRNFSMKLETFKKRISFTLDLSMAFWSISLKILQVQILQTKDVKIPISLALICETFSDCHLTPIVWSTMEWLNIICSNLGISELLLFYTIFSF